jgi:DNA-binding MarR family transcriptional regulator/N-acetylglutamate synthase-like GNAT family acetyltransferase
LSSATLHRNVAVVRDFNRFYTRQIGLLSDGVYDSRFSLTEVRVLYELANRDHPTAKELGDDLGLDAGYLSRILWRFEKQGYLLRQASSHDRRHYHLLLTKRGRQEFAPLDKRSAREVAGMLERLPASAQTRVVAAMRAIRADLAPPSPRPEAITLRSHQPGDMGWVVQRHGELYWQEYRYDERFEALVAGVVAEFIEKFDPKFERCWIAERDGERLGSIFLVKASPAVAKLRLLLVEPSTRGSGIGKRLVRECVTFARHAGYKKIILWTQSELSAARHLYEQAGFKLTGSETHDSWSRKGLVAETWELPLSTGRVSQ